ncbi:hypothetical protein [Haliea sp. E17]|uniref:hypothetical protein n=1 Tax=Haliea sp. E17 TaxID=3401576 RepID=UPI003AB100D4
MKIRAFFTFLLAVLVPFAANAGGSAIIDSGRGGTEQMRLEYDESLVRMGMPGQADNYMILRDGQMYSVISQDGKPMVIAMNSMMRKIGGMAGQQNMLGDDDLHKFVSLAPTGSSEQVAGISGKVYRLTYIDNGGKQRTETLVLSRDKRAREMTRAFMQMSTTMMEAMQTPQPEGREKFESVMDDQGMLRYGDSFQVVSFGDGTPSAARFELPAKPTELPDFGINFGGGNVASSGSSGSQAPADSGAEGEEKSGFLGKIFGDKAERQQDRQENRADNAIDSATDKAVDKALDKVFSIFD